jgi:hypothetical protein
MYRLRCKTYKEKPRKFEKWFCIVFLSAIVGIYGGYAIDYLVRIVV